MGQTAQKTQKDFSDALKDINKFKPTPYLKSDFDKFKLSAQKLMDFLDGAVDTSEVQTARTEFSKNKPAFDTAKVALIANKKKVNDAQPGQAAKLKSAQGARGDVANSAQTLTNALKGKTGPEADLSKAVFNFAAKLLPKIADTEAPGKIDDVI